MTQISKKSFSSSLLISIAACLWVVALVASLALGGDDILMRMGAVGAAALSAGLVLCAARPVSWPSGVILPALALSAVWVAASVLWSDARAITIMMVPTFLVFPLLTIAVAALRCDDLLRFIRVAGAGGFAVIAALCVWALVQYYALPDMLVAGQVREPFANPNAYASFLNCAIFAALAVAFVAAGRVRMMAWGLIALILIAQATISSRGGLFVLMGGIVVLTLLEPRMIRAQIKPLLACIGAGVAGLIATLIFAQDGQATMFSRMANIADHPDNFILGRTAIWDAAVGIVARYPILGTGYGTFFLHYPYVRTPVDEWSGGFMAHNDYLQILIETGPVGVVVMAVILAAAVMAMVRMRKTQSGDGQRVVASVLFCGVGAVVAHAIFDFPFYTLPIMLVLPLMMAVWMVCASGSDAPRRSALFGHRYADLALVVALVAGMGVWAQTMLGERALVTAERLFQQDDVNGFAAKVNEGHSIGMGMNDRSYAMAARIPMGIIVGKGSRINDAEKQALVAQADNLLTAAQRHNPFRPGYYMQQAELATMAGTHWPSWMPDAEALLRHALTIDPRYLPARKRLAVFLAQNKRGDEAYEVLKQGLDRVYLDRVGEAIEYYDDVLAMADKRGEGDDPLIQRARAEQVRAQAVQSRAIRKSMARKAAE
ncbi:O-antigen ligase family protein [Micavibrio aeruginosavorus]|uniref:O-antigen ligase family protein n=1 Tax=Micavibrio aeruginosavorus TaxID=349221 RepID=UPI003F4AF096